MGFLFGISGGTALVLLVISIVLARRNRQSRTIPFVPGLIGVLLGAICMLFSLFQASLEGAMYLMMSIMCIVGALVALFIMLMIGQRLSGQRS
ncbi:hypothetical protein [Paenibacillus wenxiniae]|uniref:YesK-like protein n=1 Tax=Paenibacillus wenxiniae TaxID=1636843 RepID=A0ABW4RP31_9BACL